MNKKFVIFKENIIYLVLMLVLFLFVLFINNNYINEVTVLDESITNFINLNIQSPILTKIMLAFTFLGSFAGLTLIIIISFLVLKNKKISLLISINLLIIFLLNNLLKFIYRRPRPEFILIKESGTSFPSGHSMCSIAFYGLLIYLANKYIKNKKKKVLFDSFLVLLILLIGFSRIYLNVHYFTDVIFGYIFGLLSLLLFINIVKYKQVKL